MEPKRPPRRRGRRGGARRRGRKPSDGLATAAPAGPAPEGAAALLAEDQPSHGSQTFAEPPPASVDAGTGNEAISEPGPEAHLAAHGIDEEIEPVDLQPVEAGAAAGLEVAAPTPGPTRPVPALLRPATPAVHPGGRKSPIEEAITHAEQIAANLRAALEDMEEILELLEIAQVQKIGDEREIADLRRALQRLQRHDLGGGSPSQGHGRGHGYGDRHPSGHSGSPASPPG